MSKQRKFNEKISSRVKDDIAYNCRIKVVTSPEGEQRIIQQMVADRAIFIPKVFERATAPEALEDVLRLLPDTVKLMTAEELQHFRDSMPGANRRQKEKEALSDALAEYASNRDEWLLKHFDGEQRQRANRERAARRARAKLRDYVLADYDLQFFITLTLSGEAFARDDIATATKKLQIWLNNNVQRMGLKYILVPEYHKDGKSIHWHGFINDALPLTESGTYIPPTGGKPIKESTVRKKGLRLEDCTPVYNIPAWDYGFTTAIRLYGEREAAASYAAKYITKAYQETDGDTSKIGGRYYLHGGKLRTPRHVYCWGDYDTAEGWEAENPGCRLKVKNEIQKSVKTEEENLETWCGATKEEWTELYESASTE